MKKIILTSLASALIVVPSISFAWADYMEIMPISNDITTSVEKTDLSDENKLIIRNNKIESDYEYNNINYYTSKIKAENIVIPEDIKNESNKIYFLVEEWSRIFYMEDSMLSWKWGSSEVKDVYNYKIVDFTESKDEYLFQNKDLVKNFWDDDYVWVSITLMADMKDATKMVLSNPVYIDINNKRWTLSNLLSKNNPDRYYGYYNTSKLEDYLLEFWDKLSREQYKKILNKADSRIKSSIEKNNDTMETLLNSINKESDFEKNLDKYQALTETTQLLNSLNSAVKNQIQSIRAYDIIDALLK